MMSMDEAAVEVVSADGAEQADRDQRAQEKLPLPARAVIAATAVAAAGVLWSLSDREVVLRPLTTFVILALLCILFELRPIAVAYKNQTYQFSLSSAHLFALLTLFGVFPAVIIQMLSSAASDLLHRKEWPKLVFNAVQLGLAVAAGGLAMESALGREIVSPGISFDPPELLALLLGLVTFWVVNVLFTGAIILLAHRATTPYIIRHFVLSEGSFIELASLLLVPSIAISMQRSPLLGLFMLVPIAILYHATRLALENLRLLEERTSALEEKLAVEQMAREREAAREAAERANRAKSDFLSHMSHELRTPLNAILGFAQLLEMDALTTEQKESTTEILKAGQHLLELINEVLDIARIEVGRVDLAMQTVDAVEAVKDCISLLAPLAAQKDVALSLEGDIPSGELSHVAADRQRLKQVILNLVSNGIKYNRQHGSVRISIEPVEHDRRLTINVVDTGNGIPPERIERLFVPFERLGAEASNIEGTGLGLALSKPLVEAMGGWLEVESEPGKGSTFSVSLSLAEEPSNDPDKIEQADARRVGHPEPRLPP